MKINILGSILILLVCFELKSQNILRGVVMNEKGDTLVGALVYVKDKSATATTNTEGVFELNFPKKSNKELRLLASFVGCETQEIDVKSTSEPLKIALKCTENQLNTVQIGGKRMDNSISTLDPRNVERITSNELRKAPCCNLSESFETNGAVTVQYADAITGAKEIQLLGLRGLYTQLLTDNVPDFYGLAMPYALEYLPGTWLRQIDVNKGAGSVKNGFQSITGQINAALVEPGEDAPVFVNIFGENTGRMEANVHLNRVEGKNFAHSLLLHGSSFQNKLDRDRDFFVDMPLKNQLNGMYRAFFNNGKWESQLKIHGLTENRKSGQLIDNERNIKPFLIDVNNNRLSAGLKLGYVGFEKPYNSIGSQWSMTYHDVAAQYGKNRYEGTQRSFLGNVLYATILGTTDHKITYGASLQYDDFQEFLNAKDLSRRDIYTGLNAEYVYARPNLDGYNDFTIVAGLRGDYHNRSGFRFTPRLNLKYNFNEGDVVRVSASRGWRVANPIAENVAFLATNREIVISDDLKPEDAWNFGLNFVKTFKIGANRTVRWNLDLYRTQFTNQVIADIESDFKTAQFYNLDGKSFSNTLLTMLTAEVFTFLDIKIAYTLTDVQATYQGQLARVPLVPRHRGLVGLDVKTTDKKWLFNATAQLVGQQRLADRSYTPHNFEYNHDGISKRFGLVNFSVNHFFKNMEVYGGVENAFDYTQEHAIIAWQEPSSNYFDATQVYAPMLGRRIYAGLRCRFGVKK